MDKRNHKFSLLLPQGSRAHSIEIEYLLGSYVLSVFSWTPAQGKKLLARINSSKHQLPKKIFDLAGAVVPASLIEKIVDQLRWKAL
jgi:hypothetical protein